MKDFVFSRIAPLSKKDRVVAALREAIVSGRMKPGDPIVESRVARELGVGQPLVREALLDLEHHGFVQRVPYRGTSVTKLGPQEIEQIQRMRVEMESLAVEWARTRIKDEDVRELRSLVEGMREAARRKDLARFNDYDLALHRRLWQLCGNKYLQDALERAVVPLLTFFYLSSRGIEELHVKSVEHHAALVEALASARPTANGARRALRALKDLCRALVSPRTKTAIDA
jgi:DNA-binding GntR family transcriptional regulator